MRPSGDRPLPRATLARVLRVGLTGGIGAGKSTVTRRLAERGAVVVDADLLAREVVAPGSDGLAEVAATFSSGVVAADGSLDRAALGGLVFGDTGARKRLEAITHPRIQALTEQRFALASADAVVVHDVPLLVELGYEDRYHLTVVVHAGLEERVRRLVTERGSTEADARRRVGAQADDDARRRAADVWLDNTGAREGLLHQVDRLWRDRLVGFEVGVRTRSCVSPPPGPVLVVPDPTWAATGARLAARVRRAAGDLAVGVDHVGSTAVAHLVAEDVIDLQLVVPDLAAADAVADRLGAAGFPRRDGDLSSTPRPGDGEGRMWFERLHGSADPGRPVTLHVRPAGSPGVRYALLLRDWLRAEPDERDRYAGLERGLAESHPSRRDHAGAGQPWSTDDAWPRMQAWAERSGWVGPP